MHAQCDYELGSQAVFSMLDERGAVVLKETKRTISESGVVLSAGENGVEGFLVEVAIDPEFFRQVEDSFKEVSGGVSNYTILIQNLIDETLSLRQGCFRDSTSARLSDGCSLCASCVICRS